MVIKLNALFLPVQGIERIRPRENALIAESLGLMASTSESNWPVLALGGLLSPRGPTEPFDTTLGDGP